MKRILLLFLVCCSFVTVTNAQSLPANTCGVKYTYDAAGNRTQRIYICNNTNIAYKPVLTENLSTNIQQVTELYPNPTTGRFTVSFTQPLNKATVTLLDLTGKVLERFQKSGNQIVLDLSVYRSGAYIVRVLDGSNPITFKVVKQ